MGIFLNKFRHLVVGSGLLGSAAFAQTESPRIRGDEPFRIQIPPSVREARAKVRIRNLETGKELILDSRDDEFIASETVRTLMDGTNPAFQPEISVLEARPEERKVPFPGGVGFYQSRSLVFDQPTWRKLDLRVRQDAKGVLIQALSTGALTPVDAERRRSLREGQAFKRLFEIGWEALGKRRYDIGLEAFGRLLARKAALAPAQRAQAHLGRGIALFHQKGCESIDVDLREADRDEANRDDVSYYRALCLVEAKKSKEAGGIFQSLLDRQNPRYADQSRFYLGVVAENEERWDEAETAYLDTIDFAADKGIVALATQRLEAVRRARSDANYQNKIFSVGLVGGFGFDSNVVALPQELSPEAYNVSDEASTLLSAIGFFEIKPPWGDRIDHRLRATAVAVHYANGSVADLSDSQIYDAATTFAYSLSPKESLAIGANYASVYRGWVGRSTPYLAVPGFELRWFRVLGDPAASPGEMETAIKYVRTIAKQTPASEANDPSANSYLLSWRYVVRKEKPHVFGPGVDFEFHPAAGTETSYYSLSVLGRWDLPISQRAGLSLAQEGSFQYTPYYRSALQRKDFVFRYSGSLVKPWTAWFETRLQGVGTLSFSTDKLNYQYYKYQLNLLMTLVY